MDTVEEFMGVQSGQRKIVQQAKYPENIQTKWIGPKNAWNPVSNGLVNSIYLIVLILDYARWNQTRNRLAPLRDPPLISHKEVMALLLYLFLLLFYMYMPIYIKLLFNIRFRNL